MLTNYRRTTTLMTNSEGSMNILPLDAVLIAALAVRAWRIATRHPSLTLIQMMNLAPLHLIQAALS